MALIWLAVFCICCLPPFSLLLSKRQKQDSFTRATNCSELHTSHFLEYRCSLLSNWVSLSALQFCVYKLFKYGPDPASPIQKQHISKKQKNCIWCFYQLSHCQATSEHLIFFHFNKDKWKEASPCNSRQLWSSESLWIKTYQTVLFLHEDDKGCSELPSVSKTLNLAPQETPVLISEVTELAPARIGGFVFGYYGPCSSVLQSWWLINSHLPQHRSMQAEGQGQHFIPSTQLKQGSPESNGHRAKPSLVLKDIAVSSSRQHFRPHLPTTHISTMPGQIFFLFFLFLSCCYQISTTYFFI